MGQMILARKVAEAGHAKRKADAVKVRIPLRKMELSLDGDFSSINEETWEVVLLELNIKNILINGKIKFPKKEIEISDEELAQEGKAREIIRQVQQERKKLGCSLTGIINVSLPYWPEKFTEYIKRETLSKSIIKGDKFSVMPL